MEAVKVIGVLTFGLIVAFASIFGLSYWVLGNVNIDHMQILAAFLSAVIFFGMPFFSAVGYYFGRVESRGFLAGIDATFGRMFDPMVKVVRSIENSANRKNQQVDRSYPPMAMLSDTELSQLLAGSYRSYNPERSEPDYNEEVRF